MSDLNFTYYYSAYIIASLFSNKGTSEDKSECSYINCLHVIEYLVFIITYCFNIHAILLIF